MTGLFVSRKHLLNGLKKFNRPFTSCPVVMASGKEHRQRKQAHKRKEDREWQMQKSMNPFMRNIGAARQLKGLEIDADDPTFGTEQISESLGDLEASLEDKRDRSKAFRAKYKADEELQQELAKRRIIQKKIFPKPPNPALLTWMEKEMIRYLHKKDPVEWSIERLAESFPATRSVIHKVVKSKTLLVKDKIQDYNKEVVNNWKLLSKGKLELDPEYERHLKAGNKNLSLSSGEKNLAEQEILVNTEKSLALPKPAVPGEFASIIVNYNNKIARDKENKSVEVQEVFEMQNLFGDNTIPGTPLLNEVSAYTDTALLASNIDLSREKHMDVDKFRELYLKNDKKQKKKDHEDPNPFREKYLDWVKKEAEKSKYATKDVEKIEASEVSKIDKESKFLYEAASINDEIDVKVSETGETYVYDPEAGYKQPYINPQNPDFLEIPEELKNKYKLYQFGDSFYDMKGEFIYRVPGLV